MGLRRKISIIIICVVLLFTVGCGKSQPSDEQVNDQKISVRINELAISIPDEVESLDPLKIKNSWELQVISNIYEGMVVYNSETRKIEPALAKEWSSTSDGLTYTFRLRDKAYFHSGKEVTASDIKASWERAIKHSSAATWYIFKNINGYEQFYNGKTEDVAGITVLNDDILQVTLDTPDEMFLLKLTHPAAAIVDAEYIKSSTLGYGVAGNFEKQSRVNGTGPFSLVEWAAHQNITLEPFEEHPTKCQFTRIDFSLTPDVEMGYADLKCGYVEILRNGQKLPDLVLTKDPIAQEQITEESKSEVFYLGFNVKQKFQDQSLRQAISYAIDRVNLTKKLGMGKVAEGLLPREIIQNRSPLINYIYSLESARNLINYNTEEPLNREKLLLYYVDEEMNNLLVDEIVKSIDKAGIVVEAKALDSYQELYTGIESGSISFYLDRRIVQAEEAGFFLTPLFHSKSPFNLSGYSNELVDDLLAFLQNQKPFSKEYVETILQLEKIIMSDVPMITLLEKGDWVVKSNLVSDTAFHPIWGIQLLKVRMNTEVTL